MVAGNKVAGNKSRKKGGCLAHLANLVHKRGRKTSTIHPMTEYQLNGLF